MSCIYVIILFLRDIWSRVLRLEGFSDYQYRYFICRQFATENEGDSDVILVKWWEGHIRPRVFSPQGMSGHMPSRIQIVATT